jgi:TonB family protein
LEIKTIAANIFLSVIIHIALLMFLVSFRDSKSLPDSNVNVPLLTLVSSRAIRQTTDAFQSQTAQKRQSLSSDRKNSQSFEQVVSTVEANESEIGEIGEVSGMDESEIGEIGEVSENFQNEKVKNYESPQTNSPKPLYMPKIPYPRAAKSAKIEGIAEISYTIDTTGRVVSMRLLSSPHVLFEKTIEKSVLSWRFSPATQNGKPVSINANQTIVFKLTD